jgi:Leucine-rich repeat (LRR) protein
MLSGNRLSSLPSSLSLCTNLELARLGANNFTSLPPCILQLPRLAWLCFSGNPITQPAETRALDLCPSPCNWVHIQLHEKLGEGASGVIYRAALHDANSGSDSLVAVKVFKRGLVTSDGYPSSEAAAWTHAGAHASVVPVLRSVLNAPDAASALVMPLVSNEFAAIASPPSMESCTRDVYVTRHTSHVTRHTSHVTRHTSHVTRHTSLLGAA